MKNIINRQNLNNQGFTLLEVIIAITILTIGILSLYSMQVSSLQGNAKANVITQSSNAVLDKIEKLFSKKFSDSDFSTGNHSQTAVPPINSINWTVTDWDNDGISNDGDTLIDEFDERGVKSIQLTIQYTDNGTIKNTTIHFLRTEIF